MPSSTPSIWPRLPADTRTLKQLSQRGEGEYAGACPCCGGEDRFYVKGERFYCRKCYPRGGDLIDLVRLIHGVNFTDACQMLAAGDFSFPERPTLHPAQTAAGEAVSALDWRSTGYHWQQQQKKK